MITSLDDGWYPINMRNNFYIEARDCNTNEVFKVIPGVTSTNANINNFPHYDSVDSLTTSSSADVYKFDINRLVNAIIITSRGGFRSNQGLNKPTINIQEIAWTIDQSLSLASPSPPLPQLPPDVPLPPFSPPGQPSPPAPPALPPLLPGRSLSKKATVSFFVQNRSIDEEEFRQKIASEIGVDIYRVTVTTPFTFLPRPPPMLPPLPLLPPP